MMTDLGLMSGLATVLREASAALGRLGGRVAVDADDGANADKANIEEAALALEQVADTLDSGAGFNSSNVPSLSEKLGAIARGKLSLLQPTPVHGARSRSSSSHSSRVSETVVDEEAIQSFVARHQLDSWIGEALSMLSPSQRSSVIGTPLNVEHARNPNGVAMSRVKMVTPVEQRIQIFIKVNDLGEGVVDRLSTLTAEQCEAVMDSGMKIQRASNPSGVAMSRISEAVRNLPAERRQETSLRPRLGDRYRKVRSRSRRRTIKRKVEEMSEMPQDVKHLMQELGLEVWCGEVLRQLSLWQRQLVVRDLGNMQGVRNPTGVVISRIKQVITPDELLQIFIDLNQLDPDVEGKLWEMTPEQRAEVLAPGIYVQNVRNTSTAVRSRIGNVLEGRSAMTRVALREYEKGRSSRRHTPRSRSRRSRRRRSTKSDASGRKRRRKD